jgi:hypothetical protein
LPSGYSEWAGFLFGILPKTNQELHYRPVNNTLQSKHVNYVRIFCHYVMHPEAVYMTFVALILADLLTIKK